MSDGHDEGHEHDDAAEAHDDHGFDGEPATELGPDEPTTPMWLPGLGAAIFVLAAILLLTRGDAVAGSGKSDAAEQKPAVPVQTAAAARPTMERTPPGRPALPPGAASGTAAAAPQRKLSAEQLKELQKRIQEAKAKQAGGDGAK